MEVLTAVIVMTILLLMAVQSFSMIRGKAERARCESNLRSLYAAATSYVTDQESWPQIPVENLEDPSYAQAWIDAFTPYRLGRINWICPAIQKMLGNPSYGERNTARIDYIPTPFDDRPRAAYQFPNHPWFMERGDVHGDGNLLMFTNGQIKSLMDVKRDARTVVVP